MSSRDSDGTAGAPGLAAIAVYGATGTVGRRVCEALRADGPGPLRLVGRRRHALVELAGAAEVAEAAIDDPAALTAAFAGARVVINAAGPLRDTAEPVLTAALAAGAHYVAVGGEQAVLRTLYERCESAVRHAGLVALPGAGVDAALGDLAAAWAADHLAGPPDGGDGDDGGAATVRSAPAARRGEDHPLDDIAIAYAFDDLVLSAGSQRALFGAIGERALVWHRDRWEPGRAGDHRRINPGPALGGERDAVGYAGGAVITVPRHVAAQRVAAYLSAARRPVAAAALRVLARALPLLPRAAGDVLAPYAAPDTDYGATRLAVVAAVRRGFSQAQVVVHGRDLYRTTAAIAAWSARQLAERGPGPTGMRAPGELFRAEPALRAIARAADLTIEPSFG
ncbi:MAG TPA: NAD(P)H-binding protein [Kofleriaceae bacterium]|nr:NAD(P)H-binding protein [Kofleriaceae bacterium]